MFGAIKVCVGRSVAVDYMAGIELKGNIKIRPLLSNPYCLQKGKRYDVKGYLYRPGQWKVVETIAQSTDSLSLS